VKNTTLSFSILLVRFACYGFLTFAFFWWLAVLPAIDWPARFIIDVSDWPVDRVQQELSRDVRFLSAIGSGLLAGVSCLILFIVVPELEKQNASVVRGAIYGIVAWYLVDSAGCALLGIYSNVVLNTIYAALIIPPLLLARRSCSG